MTAVGWVLTAAAIWLALLGGAIVAAGTIRWRHNRRHPTPTAPLNDILCRDEAQP